MMQGFRSVGGLQRFISVFSAVRNLFVAPQQERSALATHIHRIRAMAQWKAVTGAVAWVHRKTPCPRVNETTWHRRSSSSCFRLL